MVFIVIGLVLLVLVYFFTRPAPTPEKITWGVNFSQMQSQDLGLDWKQNYLALMEDLGAKNIKILTNWDFIESNPPSRDAMAGKEKHIYNFDDIDWQIKQAENHNVSLIYVVGMKTGRWPECHVPGWAGSLSKTEQQESILEYITLSVKRYKGSKSVIAWQAENEPLFRFGKCPWYDKNFLKKEVALIQSLDPARPVIVSDSGEQSLWFSAAKIGDVVGTTMYRKVWIDVIKQFGMYPILPVVYYRKAQLIKYLFNKKVLCVELQAEPWAPPPFSNVPMAEQEKSMNLALFKENIEYAKKTGLDTFYFWGAEWWYWLRETQKKPEIWNEAKKLF